MLFRSAIAFGYRLWVFRQAPCPQEASLPDTAPQNTEILSAGNPLSRQKACLVFWAASACFLTFVCLRFGFPKARAAAWEAKSRLQFSQSFVDIKNYFYARPDCFYYLDMDSFGSFTEDGLQNTISGYDNFLYLGSWIPHSPWYDAKFERQGIADPARALYEDPEVFVVFMNTEGINYDYLTDFYAENYPGVSLKVVDTVDVSNDLQFLILKGTAD